MEHIGHHYIPIHQRVNIAISTLPSLTLDAVPHDEACPICLMSFADILSAEESLSDEQKLPQGRVGVTKLVGCGHFFCMKDLTEWIRNLHGSCPTCRHVFSDITPPSESDGESSDGGEYIPDDDEDEDDGFLDTDGFSDVDVEFDVDMQHELENFDYDPSDIDGVEEWDSTDGSSFSETSLGGMGEDIEPTREDIEVSISTGDDTLYDTDVPDESK